MQKADEKLADARETWDGMDIQKVRDVSWISIPTVNEYEFLRFGRQTSRQLYRRLLRERYTNQDGKPLLGAALVCGDMIGESRFFANRHGVSFSEVDGYDLSGVSLNRFQHQDFQFNPHEQDANDLVLEPERYHLIVGLHGVHHVYNLGGIFFQAHKGLKENGVLVLDEWIGPPYLQIPLRNHLIASFLLLLLFPSKALRTNHDGWVKGVWLQYRPAAFDPSEACNSNELVPQLKRYFKPLSWATYGGLCYPMFEGLGHQLQDDMWTRWRLKFICVLEYVLTQLRIIRPLFLSAVLEKRPLNSNQANAFDAWLSKQHWLKRLLTKK